MGTRKTQSAISHHQRDGQPHLSSWRFCCRPTHTHTHTHTHSQDAKLMEMFQWAPAQIHLANRAALKCDAVVQDSRYSTWCCFKAKVLKKIKKQLVGWSCVVHKTFLELRRKSNAAAEADGSKRLFWFNPSVWKILNWFYKCEIKLMHPLQMWCVPTLVD